MFANNRVVILVFKKIVGREALFGWEITAAVLLKFLLLGGLWWLFFAGNKHTVDGNVIAQAIYGDHSAATLSNQNQEHFK